MKSTYTLLTSPRCFSCTRETLDAALAEYNAANAVMDLVLFDEVRHVDSCATLGAKAVVARSILRCVDKAAVVNKNTRYTSWWNSQIPEF